MRYVWLFLEGIVTFISPCLLPMLPIYISYFAGGQPSEDRGHTIKGAVGFVLGFTIVFTIMGAFAGALGMLLSRYQVFINIATGMIVLLLGLHYLGVLRWNLFRGMTSKYKHAQGNVNTFLNAVFFGCVFSLGWTPCVGTFLGSALMLASQQGSAGIGIRMLLCYSAGLGIPFIISAVLIDRLKGAFSFIKSHYKIITQISGIVLVLMGVLMMTGLFGTLLAKLS
ncbi:cytochrome c biogenesis protein CcdA [Lachnospiraceae bacterium ZAX-1]